MSLEEFRDAADSKPQARYVGTSAWRRMTSLVTSFKPGANPDVTAIMVMRKIIPKTQIVISIVVHKDTQWNCP